MQQIEKFALTAMINDPACIQIVKLPCKPTFDTVFDAWKKYRGEKYVIDAYGEGTKYEVDVTSDYSAYTELFDVLTLNDNHDAVYWLCIVFEDGDEILISREGDTPKFIVLNCTFSLMPGHVSRNAFRERRLSSGDDGEYVVALLHK
jgi:hypothetical protein